MLSVQTKNHFASERNEWNKGGGHRDTRCRSGNKLVSFLRAGCQFFAIWPLNLAAPKWKLALSKVLRWLHFANELWSVLALINGLGCCFTAVSALVKSVVELIFVLESSFNFIYYRVRAPQFQRLIREMEYFFETSDPRYTAELTVATYILVIPYVAGASLFAFAPLLTENTLIPLNTVYLLIPNEKIWGRCVAYALNVVNIVSAASVMFLDLLTISIMWYAGCKFALLPSKLNSLNEKKIRVWIGKHQRAISYAGKVNCVVAPLAVKSTIAVALYVIVSGLVIINKVPAVDLSKFFIVTIFSMLRFLACSWAADELTTKAQSIAWDVYNAGWIEASPKERRVALTIIQRCQNPIAIHAAGVLNAWSLKFCGQVFYGIFTFFSTLKAALRI